MGSKTEVTMAARSSSSAVALLMMVYMAEMWGSPVISVLIIQSIRLRIPQLPSEMPFLRQKSAISLTTAFLLYIVFFCAFRNPKQTQYWAYALAYGFFILWEWFVDQNVADCALLNIDAEFTLNYFIIPFKEAMLLFIILDTFLKAKEELNQEKRLRNEEKKIC